MYDLPEDETEGNGPILDASNISSDSSKAVKILHTFNSLKKSRNSASSKPPVASSAERSKSFNPKSRQRQISGFLNRSLIQLPKSFSHNSLDRGAAKLGR